MLVDPTQDEILGRYMSRYLESIYPALTSRFGYLPPGKTKIEILKNHMWFSGRTIGLSFVPTVGACTGRVVALASPKATRIPFNWARVLTHEVTHVITLQQTEFNIPHWYTEALAVESEGYPRPQEWNKMLLERVPAASCSTSTPSTWASSGPRRWKTARWRIARRSSMPAICSSGSATMP